MADQGDISKQLQRMQIVHDELARYQSLLRSPGESDGSGYNAEELDTRPLIWWDVKKHIDMKSGGETTLTQYAVLGYESPKSDAAGKTEPSKAEDASKAGSSNLDGSREPESSEPDDRRKPVLLHTTTPLSAFLCGSQGSGKSHTLSCMLENCLLDEEKIGKNHNPLAGLVLHYDGSRSTGVCEAAYLCSKVTTKVLVSASNYRYGSLKKQYEEMAIKCNGYIQVHKLMISSDHLDTEQVKTLMAVAKDGDAPLYIQASCWRKICD
jgi:hypothetical protein